MNFKTTILDPLQKDAIELGILSGKQVLQKFDETNWQAYLEKLENAKKEEIFYSPTFTILSEDNKYRIDASLVEGDLWYVWYTRPKKYNNFWGEKISEAYISQHQVHEQSMIRSLFEFLVNEKYEEMEIATQNKNEPVLSDKEKIGKRNIKLFIYLIIVLSLFYVLYDLYVKLILN